MAGWYTPLDRDYNEDARKTRPQLLANPTFISSPSLLPTSIIQAGKTTFATSFVARVAMCPSSGHWHRGWNHHGKGSWRGQKWLPCTSFLPAVNKDVMVGLRQPPCHQECKTMRFAETLVMDTIELLNWHLKSVDSLKNFLCFQPHKSDFSLAWSSKHSWLLQCAH